MFIKKIILGVFTLFFIASCSDPNLALIEKETENVRGQIDSLRASLDDGTLTNAAILQSYVAKTKKSHPEYESILDNLYIQSTSNGTAFKQLSVRFQKIPVDLKSMRLNSTEALEELKTLRNAADETIFNENLIDEINTVAALSAGALLPLNLPDGETSKAGENLVGNPSYGKWRNTSNGQSVWAWYGQYMFFSSIFRPPYYSRWYYNRPWSYGYDSYYNNYGSRSWKNNEVKTLDRNYNKVREYGKTTNRRAGSYATRNNTKIKSTPSRNANSLSTVRRQTAAYGPKARKSSPYSSSSRSGTRSYSSRGGK